MEPSIAPSELWLLNIYGEAYIVEMEASSLGLQLVLHRVDSTLGIVYFKTYVSLKRWAIWCCSQPMVLTSSIWLSCCLLQLRMNCSIHRDSIKTIEDFHPAQVETETVILSVLDNVLFLSFRGMTLFVDIFDAENTYYLERQIRLSLRW